MLGWLTGKMVGLRAGVKSDVQPLTITGPEHLLQALHSQGSAAGVAVNQVTAMRQATVFACILVLGEAFAQASPKVYKRAADGSKVEAPEHWLWSLLRESPCTDMDPFAYQERKNNDLNLDGNHFAFKVKKGKAISELIPLCPKEVSVERNKETRRREYRVDGMATLRKTVFSSDEIFHVHRMSRDGLRGMSPIEQCRNTFGLTMAAERHGLNTFTNGASPSGVLEFPDKLDEDQYDRLQEDLDTNWNGQKANRTMILESGAKFSVVSLSNKDAQFLETRGFSRSEICGIFRVPPHMVADLSRSTNNNIEQQALEFIMHGVVPALRRDESVWNSGELRGTGYFLEYNVDALIRGDFKTRMDGYTAAIQHALMTPNEARAKENWPAMPFGDSLLMMANVVSLEKAVTAVAAPTEPSTPPSPPASGGEQDSEGEEEGTDSTDGDSNTPPAPPQAGGDDEEDDDAA